jgi:hypothetical protein
MTIEHVLPDKLWIYWCPECGKTTQINRKIHISSPRHPDAACAGQMIKVLYAPIINVQRVINDAAARYASTGDAPNVLLSIAMGQALNEIEKAYDLYDNAD